MRRRRCTIPGETHFVTIRTVEERFALHPWAAPGSWPKIRPGVAVSRELRRSLTREGRRCVERTQRLCALVAAAEDHGAALPVVTLEQFTDSIPNLTGAVLAKAVHHSGVELVGAVAMSDHPHLTLRDPLGQLDKFLEYFNGQLAREVNRFLGRRHQLWSRRARVERVLDDDAELERLDYMLTNPQRARLVDRIEHWQGMSSYGHYFTDQPQRFLCFDRTRWHRSKRPNNIAPFLYTVTLEHSAPRKLAHLHPQAIRDQVQDLVRTRESALRVTRRAEGKPLLGVEGLALVVATDRPAQPKLSPGPICHSTLPALRKAYRLGYRLFEQACAEASRHYMRGNIEVVFPLGAHAPAKYPGPRYPVDPSTSDAINLSRASVAMSAVLDAA
jgi:REP element-mobilizing transposase RayT